MNKAAPRNGLLTIQAALLQGAALLDKAGVTVHRLSAEVLLCHAMRCERSYLYAHGEDELTELAWIHYGRYLNERLKGKPTQYITHRQEFFGRAFYVDAHVLIPRPETELLVETTLEHLKHCAADAAVLDVGTGSGAIAISISLESGRRVLASDVSLPALTVAARNAQTHKAAVRFFGTDLLQAVAPRSLDVLVSNPPYVSPAEEADMQPEVRDWEPHLALFAEEDGFEIYRRLIAGAETAVKSGGRVLLELGYQSLGQVQEMLTPRWSDISVVSDLAGIPRVIGATLLHG